MKAIIFLLSLLVTTSFVSAQTIGSVRHQSGYYKPSNQTYVQPHYKTNTNKTNHDNFTTKGNSNPYTGQSGYKAKDYSSGAYNYGKGNTIYKGTNGGQYYNNSKGNKTYVPKRY
jgi:hypothetical protein